MLKSFSHADNVVDIIPYCFIKCNDTSVGRPDLKIDFRTADIPQNSLGLTHDLRSKTFMLMPWSDSQIVNPAPMAFITSHARRDNLTFEFAYQEQLRIHLKFSLDVTFRIILWCDETALGP